MGELSQEYKGRVTFTIKGATTDEGRAAAEKYDFGTLKHGLVGFDADGNHRVTIPGHNFTKADVEAKLKELLR